MTLQPFHSRNVTKFRGYIYPLSHTFSIFYLYPYFIEHLLYIKNKHSCFLKLKAHYVIYYNPLYEVTNFIIRESLNPTKREYFAGVESSITNHQWSSVTNHQFLEL
jgi:hypothetical protein